MAQRTLTLDTKDIELILGALEHQKNHTLVLPSPPSPRMISLLRKLKSNLKTIKVSSRKQKGRNLEQWICREISELIDIPYNPDDDNSLINYRRMGQRGSDIILTGEALAKFSYNIEAKNSENLSLMDAIKQAQSNTKEPCEWMVIHKRKTLQEPIVIISWSTFKKIHSASCL
jgi:hypothetical protein